MKSLIPSLALLAAPAATAAEITYVFDSLSRIDMHRTLPAVTGILQGAASPTTVSFGNQTTADGHPVFSRCVPLFLTMLEKPGRYRLYLSVETTSSSAGMMNCGLELRS